jgi:hypothetical protein
MQDDLEAPAAPRFGVGLERRQYVGFPGFLSDPSIG